MPQWLCLPLRGSPLRKVRHQEIMIAPARRRPARNSPAVAVVLTSGTTGAGNGMTGAPQGAPISQGGGGATGAPSVRKGFRRLFASLAAERVNYSPSNVMSLHAPPIAELFLKTEVRTSEVDAAPFEDHVCKGIGIITSPGRLALSPKRSAPRQPRGLLLFAREADGAQGRLTVMTRVGG